MTPTNSNTGKHSYWCTRHYISMVLVFFITKLVSGLHVAVPVRRSPYFPRQKFLTFVTSIEATRLSDVAVETLSVPLNTGVNAEVMLANPTKATNYPTLVFIHGSFHASWCWAKHYMPFFASKGYSTAAISLRGTGGTFAGEGVKKVQIQQHVSDITAFLYWLQQEQNTSIPPVLLAHSFGGLTIMKYLERLYTQKNTESIEPLPLKGVCLMCSVPPSGNAKMTMRFIRRSLVDSYKLTVGFAMKKAITNKGLCRELFFGGTEDNGGITDDELDEIQQRFNRDTTAMIDLPDLSKQLPSALVSKETGAISFLDQLPPSLVIGATGDFVVDEKGVEETASYFGTQAKWVDSPHDVMLGTNWPNAANAILSWLEEQVV